MIFHRLECVVGLIFFFSLLFCRLEYRSHRSLIRSVLSLLFELPLWIFIRCHIDFFHNLRFSSAFCSRCSHSSFTRRVFCRLFSRICVVSFSCPHRRYVPLIFFSIFFFSFHYFILLLCAVLFICRMYSLPFCLSLKMCCCLFLLCLFWWIFSASWCVCVCDMDGELFCETRRNRLQFFFFCSIFGLSYCDDFWLALPSYNFNVVFVARASIISCLLHLYHQIQARRRYCYCWCCYFYYHFPNSFNVFGHWSYTVIIITQEYWINESDS